MPSINRADGIACIFCPSFEFAKYITEIPDQEEGLYILYTEDGLML